MAHKEEFTVITATRAELGALAHQVTAWRTERYLEAGFYDRATVDSLRLSQMPIEANRPDDYEILAMTTAGRILATFSLRRVVGAEDHLLSDHPRPWFGLESVHGTGFLRFTGPIPMEQCWEAGRFLRDRKCDSSRAVVAVTAAAARLLVSLADEGKAALIVGEVDPHVALRHLQAFGVPIRIGQALDSPPVTGLLAERYAGKKVAPFAVMLADITENARRRWDALVERDHLLEEDARAAA